MLLKCKVDVILISKDNKNRLLFQAPFVSMMATFNSIMYPLPQLLTVVLKLNIDIAISLWETSYI